MIECITEGIIIGICTSIPVGPIAILCIQRTLQKGRWHGFCSGLGAATSDTLYAALALFGLSMVMSSITAHQLIIQIVGSAIMMLFGVYIFFQNPASSIRKQQEGGTNYWQEYITAFLLTLSNPLMVFLFLGLFAHFSFLTDAHSPFYVAIGIVSIFCGAAIWWFFLTFIASTFKKRFNFRGLWLLNKITGILIALLAFIGLIGSLLGISI
ncbi:MAG: LysE family transporter [Paludibacteraceae bacterium]|nr:LysE family transporter [Paludibacteraceae bacterium]